MQNYYENQYDFKEEPKQRSLVDELTEYREEDEEIIRSFYSKKTLCPDIFNMTKRGYRMQSEIREKLLSISDKFIDFLGIDFHIHDIVLTGSLANYNWSKFSDVDLHILIDYKDSGHDPDLLKEFFDAKKNSWNTSHDIMIKSYEVELYVQDKDESHVSSGVYSILNDEWLVTPRKEKHAIDDKLILDKGDEYMDVIDKLLKEFKEGEDVNDEVDAIRKKIKRFRQSGLDRGGEYSYENLTFKLLRRNGYIEKLFDLKKDIADYKLSIK